MTQIVTRVGAELVAQLDELVSSGVVESRSDGVRRGLQALIEGHRRREVGKRITAGYQRVAQSNSETGWTDADTARMIGEEPW